MQNKDRHLLTDYRDNFISHRSNNSGNAYLNLPVP